MDLQADRVRPFRNANCWDGRYRFHFSVTSKRYGEGMAKRLKSTKIYPFTLGELTAIVWSYTWREISTFMGISDVGCRKRMIALEIPTPSGTTVADMQKMGQFDRTLLPFLSKDERDQRIHMTVSPGFNPKVVFGGELYKLIIRLITDEDRHERLPVTRRALHKLVWAYSRRLLAATLGVKEEDIKNACLKHKIPMPNAIDANAIGRGIKVRAVGLPSGPDAIAFEISSTAAADIKVMLDEAAPLEYVPIRTRQYSVGKLAEGLIVSWYKHLGAKVHPGRQAAGVRMGLNLLGVADADKQTIVSALETLKSVSSAKRWELDQDLGPDERRGLSTSLLSFRDYLTLPSANYAPLAAARHQVPDRHQSVTVAAAPKGASIEVVQLASNLFDATRWDEARDRAVLALAGMKLSPQQLSLLDVLDLDLFTRRLRVMSGDLTSSWIELAAGHVLDLTFYGANRPTYDGHALFVSASGRRMSTAAIEALILEYTA